MNLQTDTTEEALLELLDKSEEEQAQLFIDNGVLKPNDIKCSECDSLNWLGYESLADCAERLWEKAKIKTIFPIAAVYEYMYPEIQVTALNRCSMMEWLALDAKPIHRIVVALIALRRAGVENV